MGAPWVSRDLSWFQEEGWEVSGISRITLTTHGERKRGHKILSDRNICPVCERGVSIWGHFKR